MEDIAKLGLEVKSDQVVEADRRVDNLTDRMRGADAAARALKIAMGIAVAGVAAFGVGIWGAVQRLEEMKRLSAQLDQALQNTGNTARTSAREVELWAERLQERTGRAAEEIMAVSSNLATFGFGRETFFRAIELADDMAAAWGGDLRQNLEGLARALDDPEKGFAMLQKRGVQLSETQKELVKDFLDLNDKASAQGVVFEALESQVKGVAEAGFTGLERAISRGREAWEQAFEDLVKGEGQAADLRVTLENLINTLSSPEFISAVMGFGQIIVNMANEIAKAIIGTWQALQDFFNWLEGPGAQMPEGGMRQAYPERYNDAVTSLNKSLDAYLMATDAGKQQFLGNPYEGFNTDTKGNILTLGKGSVGYNPYEGQEFGSRSGNSAAEKAVDAYNQVIEKSIQRTDALKAEAEALGLTYSQGESLITLHELVAEAEATGVELTDERIEQLMALAEAQADAQLTLDGLHEAMENRSPWEIMGEEITRLSELMDRGKISADDYFISVGKAAETAVSAYASAASGILGQAEALTDALGLQGREAFEAQKAISIAQAVIAGGEAIVKSYNWGTTIGGPIGGALAAGLALAATTAQIAAIASTTYESKSLSGPAAAAPAAPSAAQSGGGNVANFNFTGSGAVRLSRAELEEILRGLRDLDRDSSTKFLLNGSEV